MNQSSLTFKAFKNASYSIIGFLWPILFTLVITPLIIFGLGVKEYGIYILITSVMSIMGILDLGLGTAVAKHMAFYHGKKDDASIVRITHSSNSLFLIVAMVGLAFSIFIALGGTHLLPERFSGYDQYSILFVIGGLMFFASNITSTFNSVLVAIQRFDVINKISMLSTALSSISMLAVVKAGGSLTGLFIVQLTVQTLISAIIFWQARKLLPIATYRFGWDKAEIKHCYKFSLVFFINNIGTSALASLDRLIIPLYVGPTNLTYYSLPGNVTSKIPAMANTLGASLFPTVSQLSGSEDAVRIRNLYVRSSRLIIVMASALTVTSISFSYELLKYWLSADIAAQASNILIVLALTNFVLALFNPLSNFLLGLGKVKFLTIASISMAALNIALLFILLPIYGIMGAAWAYFISVLPVLYFIYHVERHYLNLSNRGSHYLRTIAGAGITSVIVLSLNLFLGRFIVSLPTLLIVGGVSALVYILLYRLFGFFEKEDWHDLERFFTLFLKKIKC
jgi:O-antigen/teichoic acid export membrane protein